MPASTAVPETEDQLVSIAQDAVSNCRWVVGECAAKWTARYARGRTDADFGTLISLSGDQVYQRRRVWEAFAGSRQDFPGLKWSHFYTALNWDDAAECLQWAEEMKSTVAEMKAWRRARRGEDLSTDPLADDAIQFIPSELEAVRDPAHAGAFGSRDGSNVGQGGGAGVEDADPDRAHLAGVARQAGEDGENYAPFRSGAGSPAPGAAGSAPSGRGATPPPPTPEQLVKRMTQTLEKCARVLSPEFTPRFNELTPEVRGDFFDAVTAFTDRVAALEH